MYLKDNLRFIFSQITSLLHLNEAIRKIYIFSAFLFVRKLNKGVIEAAWIRRSTTNEDFTPFTSDIDLTLLINDKDLSQISFEKPFPRHPLIRDIEILSHRFFHAWKQTGGFRRRQAGHWKQLLGHKIELADFTRVNKEELAFELSYEVHLLMKQLAKKIIHTNSSISKNQSINKLTAELERVRNFWVTQDEAWLYMKRSNIHIADNFTSQIKITDQFLGDLIENLEPPMNIYDWRSTITKEDELGQELNITIDNLPVFVIEDLDYFEEAIKKKTGFFITTSNYIKLIKGVGIQEQNLLNKLVIKNPYYRLFSVQRLAHDLLGALICEPDNQRQLYFCFYNIEELFRTLGLPENNNWHNIQSNWKHNNNLPYNPLELIAVSDTYLDQLEALLYD